MTETFDKRRDSCPYTRKKYLLDHLVEDVRLFGTLSILDCSSFEHFIMHLDQSFRIYLQRTQTRKLEDINGNQHTVSEHATIWYRENCWTVEAEICKEREA